MSDHGSPSVPTTQGEREGGHALKITFDGWLNVEAVCIEPKNADCRLGSMGCECEEWGAIWHKPDGTIWHRVIGDELLGLGPVEPLWHQVTRQEACNVCDFLNNDDILEIAVQGTRFDVATVPIKPVWNGDGYEWEATHG